MTGTHLADVLETIDYAVNEARTPEGEHVWVELTTLLIPGFNDDDAQLHAECTWIREHLGPDVPLHFSAFHPSYRMMDVPPTPHETLTRARDIALEEGLNYVYTGNVHDREGDTTYCPNPECRAKLVERDWYRIIANRLSAGYPWQWALPRMQDCYRRTLVICLRSPARFTADRQYARQSSSSI